MLIRVDFNVPLDGEQRITDDTRIRAAMPTLEAVLEAGGTPILLSHLGRPKGRVVESLRLTPLRERLSKLLGRSVLKLDETVGDAVEAAVSAAEPGAVILLENVRFLAGETEGDPELARRYARLGDIFVNDAFGSSHRAHASVSGIAGLLPSFAGKLLLRELEAFDRVLNSPESPFVAILGGAKVSDKLPVIEHLLPRVDSILVGGAMAYTFLVAEGYAVGSSRVEEDRVDTVRGILRAARRIPVDVLVPEDHVIADRFDAEADRRTTEDPTIPGGWMGLDIGPRTRERYAEVIRSAKTLIWNGPMGVFEMEPFRAGTEAVGRAVAECPGYTVVGGGDSVAAVQLLGLADRVGHISTGGGASLELLGGTELPGISALAASSTA